MVLDHLLNEPVNLVSLLAEGSVFVEVVQFLSVHSALGTVELERPQKVSSSLEVIPNGVNLVNHILHALHTSSSKSSSHHSVITERHTLSRHLSESTLVDELLDALQVRVSVTNVRLYKAKHLRGSGIHAHKHSVVDLLQAKELQDLSHLGRHVQDTTNTDHEHKLLLRGHEDATSRLGSSAVVNGILGDLLEQE